MLILPTLLCTLIPSSVVYGMSGAGTALDPYIITTVSDLQNVSLDLTAYYELGNDIDASSTSGWNGGAGFVPIGNSSNPFTGNFNGRGYNITGLYIYSNSSGFDVGLFGYVNTTLSISDVNLIGENFSVKSYNVGGLIGRIYGGTITNSSSTGNISSSLNDVGGLIGMMYGGMVNSSYSEVNVIESVDGAGGLIGFLYSGLINNSYAVGNVTCPQDTGGLIGHQSDAGLVNNSYSTGKVTGSSYTGGLVGFQLGGGGTVSNSYWDINTSGQATSAGGTGKTTAEMKTQSTFVGWDFVNIWKINVSVNSGYPILYSYGTPSNPYIITNVIELQAMNNDLIGYYELGNDIDASSTSGWNGGAGFVPIGNSSNPFTGNFNGKNYTITNLYINRPSTNYVGLFGKVDSALSINNVGLVNENITGNTYVGGIIGYAQSNIISSVYSTGKVSGIYNVGGIIGFSRFANVINSYSMCNIQGTYLLGGLIGQNSWGTVTNTYSMGSVDNASYKGGLIGTSGGGAITSSYWDINTSGQATSAGGTGKTTAEMKTQSTFVGWDFVNIWGISSIYNNGYPCLQWQFPATSAPIVTTIGATYISSAAAQLNGFLYSNGSGLTNVWFQLSLWNGSAWVNNTATSAQTCGGGSYFSVVVYGLTSNSTYAFSAQALNSYGASNGSWINFTTTSGVLQPPTGVYITPGSTTISLYWTMGLNSSCTYIIYKIGSYPSSLSDGNVWGIINGTSGTLNYCLTGTSYYFALYGANWIGGNSSTAAYVMATTTAGVLPTITSTLPPINVNNTTTSPNGSALTNNPLYPFIIAMDDAGVGMPHNTWLLVLTLGMLVVIGLFIVARYRNLMAAMIAVIVIGVVASNLGIFPMWVLYLFGFSGLGLSWKELR